FNRLEGVSIIDIEWSPVSERSSSHGSLLSKDTDNNGTLNQAATATYISTTTGDNNKDTHPLCATKYGNDCAYLQISLRNNDHTPNNINEIVMRALTASTPTAVISTP